MAKSHSIAQAKYDSTHCKYYTMKMNLATDSDIIARLETVESKQGYIKQLIRDDIARTCSGSVPVHVQESPNATCPVCGKKLFTKKKYYCCNCNSELILQSVPKTDKK